MPSKNALVPTLCGLAIVVAGSLSSSALAAPGPTSAPATAVEAGQITLRQQFGLQADLVHVRVVDHAAASNSTELGIPLTAVESADIAGRTGLGDIAVAITNAEVNDSAFGGVWIDQSTGGTLVVNVVPAAGRLVLRPAAIKAMSAAARHRLTIAAYSLKDLDALSGQISKEVVVNNPSYGDVVSVGTDPRVNRVRLVLRDLNKPLQSVVLRATANDPRVQVKHVANSFVPGGPTPTASVPSATPQAISRNAYSGPLYGGSWISNGGPVAGGNCTAGFSHIYNSLGQWYSVTAGHCGNGTYYQGRNRQGTVLGGGHANGFATSGTSNCDCVAVGPISGSRPTKDVLVDGNALFGYTNTGGSAQFQAGQRACLSGAQSADTNNEHIICGTIVQGSTTLTETNGFHLTDAATVSFEPQQGDSGGPYGNGGSFLGIHSAYNDGLHEGGLSKAVHIASRFSAQLIY